MVIGEAPSIGFGVARKVVVSCMGEWYVRALLELVMRPLIRYALSDYYRHCCFTLKADI